MDKELLEILAIPLAVLGVCVLYFVVSFDNNSCYFV